MTEIFLNLKQRVLRMLMTGYNFKKCRNLGNEIKKAKELYYKRALDENEGNSRQIWRIINELT